MTGQTRFAALAAIFIAMSAFNGPPALAADSGTAIFAGGCFWCVESDFDKVGGVTGTTSGYIGGKGDNPTYQDYAEDGFIEAVEITFDPSVVSYPELLKIFFRSVDPTDAGGQFCDRGHAYTTAIFALDDEQKRAAEAARADAGRVLGKTIATAIEPAATFWPAEAYHQDYHDRNPLKYRYYRFGCGRDQRVKQLWGSEAHYGQSS